MKARVQIPVCSIVPFIFQEQKLKRTIAQTRIWTRTLIESENPGNIIKMKTPQKSPQAPNLKQRCPETGKKIKTYNCPDQDLHPDPHRKWKPREYKKQNENTTKIPTSTKPETKMSWNRKKKLKLTIA